MSVCRSCGAEIRWVVTAANGRRMPIDPVPRDDGNLEIDEDGVARYVVPTQPSLDGRDRFVSHFATCPESTEWRKDR